MDFKNYIKGLLKEADISEDYRNLLTEPKPLSVFQKAFTDASYDPVNNYEVLEFIGDGYVKAINSEYIPKRFGEELKKFPSKSGTGEGPLSKTRRYFEQSKLQYPMAMKLNMWNYVKADDITKTQKRNKTLENVFEAFIGALATTVNEYIYDGFGYMFAKNFLTRQLDKIDIKISDEMLDDPVTRLDELYKSSKDLKDGRPPLKWGKQAIYNFTVLFLPKVDSLPDAGLFTPGEMIFNTEDNKAYYFSKRGWVHPSEIPLNETPRAPTTLLDPKAEENKDLFQMMMWADVKGKPRGFDEVVGQGLSFTKKEAKMIAARNALRYLKEKYGIEKA